MKEQQSITSGIHHLGLTVPDVRQSADFFIEALGFKLVGEKPEYPACFVSDGSVMLTLWQAQTDQPTPFDRKTCLGLHHFALKLSGGVGLEEMHQRLAQRSDVVIEFAPEALGKSRFAHLMCRIPGGLRMELVALAEEDG